MVQILDSQIGFDLAISVMLAAQTNTRKRIAMQLE